VATVGEVKSAASALRPPLLWSLTDDEYRALSKARRSGIEGAFQFPAPSPCRSLEDWIRHGDECWRRLRAKLYRSLPTAWDSRMLMVPRV
jgi:hypothetical protein